MLLFFLDGRRRGRVCVLDRLSCKPTGHRNDVLDVQQVYFLAAGPVNCIGRKFSECNGYTTGGLIGRRCLLKRLDLQQYRCRYCDCHDTFGRPDC